MSRVAVENLLEQNAVLAGLSRDTRSSRSRLGLRMRLCKAGEVLHEAGQPIQVAYFPATAVVSLLAASGANNGPVGVALVGAEGVIGLLNVITKTRFPFRAVVQIPGEIIETSSVTDTIQLYRHKQTNDRFIRYLSLLSTQMSYAGICNHRHTIEQRLARLLLAMKERTHLKEFPVTHALLTQVLGTTRPTVTLAALALKENKVITYSRGILKINDPRALMRMACSCHREVTKELEEFLREWDCTAH